LVRKLSSAAASSGPLSQSKVDIMRLSHNVRRNIKQEEEEDENSAVTSSSSGGGMGSGHGTAHHGL
jgi:dihydroxyacetone kinase-like predicted kinase